MFLRPAFVASVLLLACGPAAAQECPASPAAQLQDMQASRRRDAGRYLEAVHAQQTRALADKGRYLLLRDLPNLPSLPVGFVPKLLADQWSYVVLLKDLFDPCGVALLLDERGVVHDAYPRPQTKTALMVAEDRE